MVKKTTTKNGPDRQTILTIIYTVLTVLVVYLIQHPKLLNLQLWPRYITLSVTILLYSLFFLFQKKPYKNTINTSLWRDPLFLCYGGLAIVMVLSLINTINWQSEGIMDSSKFVLMFMFMGISLLVLNHKNSHKILAKVAVVTMLGLLIWALAQYIPRYLFNTTGGVRDMDDVRVNFVRSNQYCIGVFLLLPFVLYQYIRKEKIWNVLTAIALYGNFFFLISIQTRSVWAALFMGFVVAGLLFILSGKRRLGAEQFKSIIFKMVFIVGAALIFFVGSELLARNLGNARSTVTQSVEKTFDKKSKFGASSRLRRWEATMRLVKEKPLFGEGAGDWKTVKYKYGLYDNSVTPHNDYLWVMSDSGLVGFVFYILLFILAFIYLFRAWYRAEDPDDRLLALCLLFGLVGYMAIQSFTFPKKGMSHQVMLTLYFTYAIILRGRTRQNSGQNIPQWVLTTVLIANLVILPFMLTFASIRLKSEHAERIALVHRAKGDHKNIIKYMTEANNKWSNIDPFNHSISSYIAESHYYLEEHNEAIKFYTQALRESPYNPNYWVNRAMAYSKLDMNDKALKDLNMAIKIQPEYQLALTNKAVILFNAKEYDAASEILYHILEINPRAGKAHYMMGLVHINRQQVDEACAYFQDAVKYGFKDAQKYIDAYCKTTAK